MVAHLNYNKRRFGDKYFMVCVPMSHYETSFFHAFRRHCLVKTESYYVKDQVPMTGETHGGIQAYSTKGAADLRMYSEKVSQVHNSIDLTKNDLWWGRLSYQNSVVTFGEHCEALTDNERELYSLGFHVHYEKYGKSKSTLGLQYLLHVDKHYRRYEQGLMLNDMTTAELELTDLEHWDL